MKTNTLPQTDALHARTAISTIIEPGDGVAGMLIDALGPVAAYDAITGNGLQAALQDAGVGERTAQESISRWTPRISSSVIAHNLASLERANVTLIDPDRIPALADLGTQRPVALYVRGNASSTSAGGSSPDRRSPTGTENSTPATPSAPPRVHSSPIKQAYPSRPSSKSVSPRMTPRRSS